MPEQPVIDVSELIGEVAKRHGIALGKDDPAFAIVTIHRLVLEKFVDELLQRITTSRNEFEAAADRIQTAVGKQIGAEARQAAIGIRQEIQNDVRDAGLQARELVAAVDAAHSWKAIFKYVTLGLAAGVILFALGLLTALLSCGR